MSDTVSSADFDGQHVELLPARTVLSMFIFGGAGENGTATNGDNPSSLTNVVTDYLHSTNVSVP